MISPKSVTGATLIGLIAPFMWGASVSLVRTIAENFGIAQGQCLLYIVAATALFFLIGFPKFDRIPWQYKTIGLATANLSSITFCLSLYFPTAAHKRWKLAWSITFGQRSPSCLLSF